MCVCLCVFTPSYLGDKFDESARVTWEGHTGPYVFLFSFPPFLLLALVFIARRVPALNRGHTACFCFFALEKTPFFLWAVFFFSVLVVD